jgi:hypothetical protein
MISKYSHNPHHDVIPVTFPSRRNSRNTTSSSLSLLDNRIPSRLTPPIRSRRLSTPLIRILTILGQYPHQRRPFVFFLLLFWFLRALTLKALHSRSEELRLFLASLGGFGFTTAGTGFSSFGESRVFVVVDVDVGIGMEVVGSVDYCCGGTFGTVEVCEVEGAVFGVSPSRAWKIPAYLVNLVVFEC